MGYLDSEEKKATGAALPFTIIVMACLLILGGAILSLVDTETLLTFNSTKTIKAQYIAESGIERALVALHQLDRESSSYTGGSYSLNGGSNVLSVSRSGNSYTVSSTGNVDGVSKRISYRLKANNVFSNGNFSSTGNVTGSGNIHVNGRILPNMSKLTVSGELSSSDPSHPATVKGQSVTRWPVVLSTPYFDFDYARETAMARDGSDPAYSYYNGDAFGLDALGLVSILLWPPGDGIFFIDGDLRLTSLLDLMLLNNLFELLGLSQHYTFVATGDITIGGFISGPVSFIAGGNITSSSGLGGAKVVFAQGVEDGRTEDGHRSYQSNTGVVSLSGHAEVSSFIGGQSLQLKGLNIGTTPIDDVLPEGARFNFGLFRVTSN